MKKILKRRHIKSLAYNVEKLFVRKSTTPLCSVEEALAYLGSLAPNSHGSCVCEHHFAEADCDVEVIVPCYNVELYVEECVESILSQQTQFSFFLTLVNDGSTDRTGEILKQYANRQNVRIITQENRGVSSARNAGIVQAHGRYLLFVDSDDILLPGSIECLMLLAERTGADITDSGFIRFADRKTVHTPIARLRATLYDCRQKPRKLRDNDNAKWVLGLFWGKVIRRELFQRVQLPEGYWSEDTMVWMVLQAMSKRLATTSTITTRYRMNPSSITHVVGGTAKCIEHLYVVLQLLDDREVLGITFDQWQYHMILCQMQDTFHWQRTLPRKVQEAVFVVESDLIKNRLGAWDTSDPTMRPLQELLRKGDFEHYRLWCKWH